MNAHACSDTYNCLFGITLWSIYLIAFFLPYLLSFFFSLTFLADHHWVWFKDCKLWSQVTKVSWAELGSPSTWPHQLQLPLWEGGPRVGYCGYVVIERSTQRSVTHLIQNTFPEEGQGRDWLISCIRVMWALFIYLNKWAFHWAMVACKHNHRQSQPL